MQTFSEMEIIGVCVVGKVGFLRSGVWSSVLLHVDTAHVGRGRAVTRDGGMAVLQIHTILDS